MRSKPALLKPETAVEDAPPERPRRPGHSPRKRTVRMAAPISLDDQREHDDPPREPADRAEPAAPSASRSRIRCAQRHA